MRDKTNKTGASVRLMMFTIFTFNQSPIITTFKISVIYYFVRLRFFVVALNIEMTFKTF